MSVQRSMGALGSIDRFEGFAWGVFNCDDEDEPLAVFRTEDEARGYIAIVGGGCPDLDACRLAFRVEVWNSVHTADDEVLSEALAEVEVES